MRPYDRKDCCQYRPPFCHWTGGFPASSDAGVTHLRCTFLSKALKIIYYPRFAVVSELILLYFLFNKLVICFICRILAFRSVTPVHPLRIRSHLVVPRYSRLLPAAGDKETSLGHIDSHVSAVPHLIAAYVRVRTIPSVASLEACEPRTSNGRVLVDVWASGLIRWKTGQCFGISNSPARIAP